MRGMRAHEDGPEAGSHTRTATCRDHTGAHMCTRMSTIVAYRQQAVQEQHQLLQYFTELKKASD